MAQGAEAIWRIDFRADLTRADSVVIPIGFMIEADWMNQARWLGMVFRKALTPTELDLVNRATWSELAALEPFMKGLFEEAWSAPREGSSLFGAQVLLDRFTSMSALQFVEERKADILVEFDADACFPRLYTELLTLRERLVPVLTAPVIPLRRRAPQRADVELMNQAA